MTVGDIQRNASPHDCCSRIVPRVSALPLGHGSAGTLHAAGPPSLRGPPSRWRSVPGRVAANAAGFVTMLKHAFSSPVTGSRNYSTFSWRKRNVQWRPVASTWCGLGKSRRMLKVPPPASNTRSTMLPVPYNCRRSAPQTWRVRSVLPCLKPVSRGYRNGSNAPPLEESRSLQRDRDGGSACGFFPRVG